MSVSVSIEDLGVAFGETEVLRGLSLDIEQGEFVTLLGPSGSGKTTTLNVIAGFIKPSGGRITFDGRPVDDLPPHRRNIGFVFQSYALFPHMTVAENVAYPLVARRVDKREAVAKVAEILELVRLPGLADRSVRSLSGGQQQRIALARALVFGPSLLLLDEPLAALDKQLRDAMQLEIRRIHQEMNMTTIAVTHDQVEALTMSDRVAILDSGDISQVGTPLEVYRKPANLFVAGFLGEANLLHASGGFVPALGVAAVGARDGTAVVRPEDLEIARTADGDGQPARVEEASFQGSRIRLIVRLESGERLIVSEEVSEELIGARPGSPVQIRSRYPAVHTVAERLPADRAGALQAPNGSTVSTAHGVAAG